MKRTTARISFGIAAIVVGSTPFLQVFAGQFMQYPPPPPHVGYGVNVGPATRIDTAIPFGDAVARVVDWRYNFINPAQPNDYDAGMAPNAEPAPYLRGGPNTLGVLGPDWEHPLSKRATVRSIFGLVFQGLDIVLDAQQNRIGEAPVGRYVLTWRGGPADGPYPQVIAKNGATASLAASNDSNGWREYDIDPGTGLVYVDMPRVDNEPRVTEIHLWLPGLAEKDPNDDTKYLGGPIVNPKWIETLNKVNGGFGPDYIRSLGWIDVNKIGVATVSLAGDPPTWHRDVLMKKSATDDRRVWPNRMTMSSRDGACPAFLAAAANALNADLHICVPHQALYPAGRPIGTLDVQYAGLDYEQNGVPLSGAKDLVFTDTSAGTPGANAAGTVTFSGGAITGWTLTNPGTGYANPNEITVVVDPSTYTSVGELAFIRVATLSGGVSFTTSSKPQLTDVEYMGSSASDSESGASLENASYLAWFARMVRNDTPNATQWNSGKPIKGLKTGLDLVVEIANETWNDGLNPSGKQMRVLRAMSDTDPTPLPDTWLGRSRAVGREITTVLAPKFHAVLGENPATNGGHIKVFAGGSLSTTSQSDSWIDNIVDEIAVIASLPIVRGVNAKNTVDFAGPSGYLPPTDFAVDTWNAAFLLGVKPATSVANGGSGYTNGTYPNVAIPGVSPANKQALVTFVVQNGSVSGVTVTKGGSGYSNTPGNPNYPDFTTAVNTIAHQPGFVQATFNVAVGTGAGDPDIPTATAVHAAMKARLADVLQKIQWNSDHIGDFTNPAGGSPSLYLYEGGASLVPGTGGQWSNAAILATTHEGMYDVYTNITDGLVQGLAAKGVTNINWFDDVSTEDSVGTGGDGPFGHFFWTGQPMTLPVTGPPFATNQYGKTAAICRSYWALERRL